MANRNQPYLRASLIVLLIALAACVGTEIGVRLLLVKVSRVEKRWFDEYRAAIQPRDSAAEGKRLLLVGNSLLFTDVDLPTLQQQLAAPWQADRFVVDDTNYYDWYYGLRRLFAEGSRYDVVVVVLTAQHLTSDRVRGSYFARRLMHPRDILAVSRDLDLHPTIASELAVASFSEFYGTRAELRKFFLWRMMPALPELAARFVTYPVWKVDFDSIYERATARLNAIAAESRASGARFILVIPPIAGGSAHDGSAAVLRAGEAAAIEVVMPLSSDALSPVHFTDGYHLNGEGAGRFTHLLARALNQALAKPAVSGGAGSSLTR